MGIDGSCKVTLLRKRSEKADSEFAGLVGYVDSILKNTGADGEVKLLTTENTTGVEITMFNDRNYFFLSCMPATILSGDPVNDFADLKQSQASEGGCEASISEICKKYDCWMEGGGGYIMENRNYYLFDNKGNCVCDEVCPWDYFPWSNMSAEERAQFETSEKAVEVARFEKAKGAARAKMLAALGAASGGESPQQDVSTAAKAV